MRSPFWGHLSSTSVDGENFIRVALRNLEKKMSQVSTIERIKRLKEVGMLEGKCYASPDKPLENYVPQEAQMQNSPEPLRSSVVEFL